MEDFFSSKSAGVLEINKQTDNGQEMIQNNGE